MEMEPEDIFDDKGSLKSEIMLIHPLHSTLVTNASEKVFSRRTLIHKGSDECSAMRTPEIIRRSPLKPESEFEIHIKV